MLTSKTRTTWDTRSWLLGLLLGNFAGLLLLCGGLPFLRRLVEAAFPYSVSGYYVGDFMVFLSLILGAFVFPAVLSSLAKRLYALWGFLPIFLLMLWLMAGCISAHRLPSLLDPPWMLPVTAAMGWAIASFPISAYRFLRQRREPSAAPALSPTLEQPSLKSAAKPVSFLASGALCLTFGLLGWYNLDHPKHFSVVMQPHWLSGKKAVIPLVEQGNGLYVNAWLNNQEVLCKVDTGAESVEWSRGLHVEGRMTSSHGQDCDLLGGCVATQTVVLPRLKIGDYEVTDIPTEMSEAGSGPFTPSLQDANQQPLLGNTAFVETVLTIDYQNSVMIIRPPQYDFLRRPRKSEDQVVDMGWTSHYEAKNWRRNLYGAPAIQTAINGFTFWCTLDTGAGGPEICLTRTLVERHLALDGVKRSSASLNAANSFAQVPHLNNISVSFPCTEPLHVKPVPLKLNALITPSLETDAADGDAVIGLPLMKQYRITIDYGRGRILLEPYARNAAK